MKSNKFLVTIFSAILLSVFLSSNVFAASGYARVYYFTGTGALGSGTTSTISSYLTNMGYSSARGLNNTVSTITSAFSSREVVHILCHGYYADSTHKGGGLQCVPGSLNPVDWIWANNLTNSMSQAELFFFESCYSGCTNPSNGRLDSTCIGLGAQSTIAFVNEITASSSSDGIHYFSQRVYYYLGQGYDITTSVYYAQTNTINMYGSYYGADSCVVQGGSNTIL